MNLKDRYEELVKTVTILMNDMGMIVSFLPYEDLKNPENTCKLLNDLFTKLYFIGKE